eukprot:92496-Chlamydomonas_euryale.AAC.1
MHSPHGMPRTMRSPHGMPHTKSTPHSMPRTMRMPEPQCPCAANCACVEPFAHALLSPLCALAHSPVTPRALCCSVARPPSHTCAVSHV